MNKVSRETLYELYIIRGKPMHEIAKELGIAVGTVYNYLKKYEIETREQHKGFLGKKHSEKTKQYIREKHKGKVLSADTKMKFPNHANVQG